MNFDDLTNLWKQQPSPPAKIWENTLAEARQGARKFDRAILWRDMREGLACGVVAAVFGEAAWKRAMEDGFATPLWIAAALPLAVIAFLLMDRQRHRDLQPTPGEPFIAEIKKAIARLRHQERLLRNVLWWYLLPLGIAGAIFGMDAVIASGTSWPVSIAAGVFLLAFLTAIHFWIHRLNQRAIVKEIQPEIAKLETALRELSSESQTSPS